MFLSAKPGVVPGDPVWNPRLRVTSLLPVLFAVAFVFSGSRILALDFADVKMLVENRVPETVITQMAAGQGDFGLTEIEADELRLAGASENLIAALGGRAEDSEPIETDSTSSPYVITDVPMDRGRAATDVMPVERGGGAPPDGSPVTPLEITTAYAFPPLRQDQGWLSISNRDWQPYHLVVNEREKRLFLSRHPNGGTVLNPGENVALNLRRAGYKLYGDTGEKLEVRIRENLTTTLSLEPFGVFGNSGLTGVANDRGKVRSEILFAPFAPAQRMIVESGPIVVAPPPRVIVEPPPVYYYYDSRPRHYYWRR